MDRGPLTAAMVVLGLVVTAWAVVALPARAVRATQTTADEPQYLLTAISLGEDFDLDISDELADRRFEPFHEVSLNPQTRPLANGVEISPHDPLLPLYLAVPMRLGGWVAAKVALAALGGVLASVLVWVAVRRFAVPLAPAVVVVAAFSLTPPLTAYATQVYPELPAALAFTLAVGALTSRRFAERWGPQVLWLASLVALSWLSVKYLPVAGVVGIIGAAFLVRGRKLPRLAALGALGVVAGLVYALVHQRTYGGWTVYASGDHFVDGEAGVIGSQPDYVGRSRRLVGLLVDNTYGLVAWAPVYFVAVAALGSLARRRPPGWLVLVSPLAAGWFTATFVALTMHGWWWPGRQVVVVIPALVLATAWWVGRTPRLIPWVVGATAVALFFWVWLLVEVARGDVTLVGDFEVHADPLWQLWRDALPPGRETGAVVTALTVFWAAVLGALVWFGWRSGGPSVGGDEDARPGELADADVLAGDLDGGGAVG